MTGRLGDLQQMAEGRPVPVTTDEFVKLLRDMPDKSEYVVFINRSGDDGLAAQANCRNRFVGRYPWNNRVLRVS